MEVQGDFNPDLDFQSERLIETADYWQALRGARRMPSHGNIDPLDLPPRLLPHLELVDVYHEAELRLRWRLIGTHLTAAVARDSTGKFFDELYPRNNLTTLSAPFKWVIENMNPLHWTGTSGFAGKDWMSFECVLFPLSSDGKTVNMILGAVHYGLR
jgi:hypothetical protein